MIGNDIIDLNCARRMSKIHHPNWKEKVLTTQEKKQIMAYPSIESGLWSFWALKESAYKIFFKKTGQRLFIPKKFRCTLAQIQSNQIHALIDSPIGPCYGRVQLFPDHIIALASTQKSFLSTTIWQKIAFQRTAHAHQSHDIRAGLIQCLHLEWNFPIKDLSIQSPSRFPQVFFKNKVLPVDVSLSHHHKWGAFAFLQAEI